MLSDQLAYFVFLSPPPPLTNLDGQLDYGTVEDTVHRLGILYQLLPLFALLLATPVRLTLEQQALPRLQLLHIQQLKLNILPAG